MNQPSWGAIFDWDGVVVDSSRPHRESWERLAAEEGQSLPPGHFERGFGMKNEKIIRELLGWSRHPQEINRLSLRKEVLYRDILRSDGIKALPGVAALLAALRAAAIPCAIGSSTSRLNITTTLEILGWPGSFPVIVSAEDVTHGKPDPAVFLLAARRINCPPARCVVFEDAPVGVAAARAAAMKVIAVETTHAAAALHQADRVVPTLTDVTVGEISAWF